jgi:hypothetical protein
VQLHWFRCWCSYFKSGRKAGSYLLASVLRSERTKHWRWRRW